MVLLGGIRRQSKVNDVTIGLTTKDISTTKGDKLDWGIMGLGYCPGNACVASSFRLKGINKLEKLFKVSIHELGHTFGLNHCQIGNCLMRNAEGKDHLNEMLDFCRACKQQLENVGWVFTKVN
jgi:archaemetzincin